MHALITNKKILIGVALVAIAAFAGSVVWNGVVQANPDYICTQVTTERSEGDFGQCSRVSWTRWAPYSTTQDYRVGTGIKERKVKELEYRATTWLSRAVYRSAASAQAACPGGDITGTWSRVEDRRDGAKQRIIIENQICQTEEFRDANNTPSGGVSPIRGPGEGDDNTPGEDGPSGVGSPATPGLDGEGPGDDTPGEGDGDVGDGDGPGVWEGPEPLVPPTINLDDIEIVCDPGFIRDGSSCVKETEAEKTELALECSTNQQTYTDCGEGIYRLVDKSSCLYVRPVVAGDLEGSAFFTEIVGSAPETSIEALNGDTNPNAERELCINDTDTYGYNPKQFQTRVIMTGRLPGFGEGEVEEVVTLQFLNLQIEEE